MYVRSQDVPLEPGAIKISELSILIGGRDPLILEIGANNGHTTQQFLQEMPNSKIFCFEPDP